MVNPPRVIVNEVCNRPIFVRIQRAGYGPDDP